MTVSTIIFSKNRPLQLDLTLSSLYLNCKDIKNSEIAVLYKADLEYEKAYFQLRQEHANKNIWFVKQEDFQEDLLIILGKLSEYIFFIVDDCIFTSGFLLSEITESLDNAEHSMGFSLRLGRNTQYVYTLDLHQNIPKFFTMANDIIMFNWLLADYDFAYPSEVSSSVYRTKDISPIIQLLKCGNPNELEATLNYATRFTDLGTQKPYLFSYQISKAFCSPLNKVQTVAPCNRSGNKLDYTPENLLKKYNEGVRINPNNFKDFISKGTHQEVDLF